MQLALKVGSNFKMEDQKSNYFKNKPYFPWSLKISNLLFVYKILPMNKALYYYKQSNKKYLLDFILS